MNPPIIAQGLDWCMNERSRGGPRQQVMPYCGICAILGNPRAQELLTARICPYADASAHSSSTLMTSKTPQAPKAPAPRAKPTAPGKPVNFAAAAQSLMFGGSLPKGIRYQEGKGRSDVEEAIRWAQKPINGRLRTEVELDMLARRLKKVFQPTLAVTPTPATDDKMEKVSEIRAEQSAVIAEARATGAAISSQGLERVSRLRMEQAEQVSQARAAGAAVKGA